ncbi:MAG: hypothetical protein NTW08_02840 [Gammaproteobacteria bacterium]|nr:hypothetical protein [Gammaproteobacteria bacterium]
MGVKFGVSGDHGSFSEKWAEQYGLEAEVVKRLFKMIIADSRRVQQE